jgi:hypothetical protein
VTIRLSGLYHTLALGILRGLSEFCGKEGEGFEEFKEFREGEPRSQESGGAVVGGTLLGHRQSVSAKQSVTDGRDLPGRA